jgi:hypothetical protein
VKMGKRRSCMNCKHYSMSAGEERGRTSFDYCAKKGDLPTAAFSFCDTCCGGPTCSCLNIYAFTCLEEIAENCEHYEEKGEEDG